MYENKLIFNDSFLCPGFESQMCYQSVRPSARTELNIIMWSEQVCWVRGAEPLQRPLYVKKLNMSGCVVSKTSQQES